jgi:class 3 adenylate cyclase
MRYGAPPPDGRLPKHLVVQGVGDEGPPARFTFYGHLEVGRDDPQRQPEPGQLLIADPTVSRVHCVVTQRADGACLLRDVSRNGTRLDGHRLVPNVETRWRVGQTIGVGRTRLMLMGAEAVDSWSSAGAYGTLPRTDRCIATVLVGDIQDYTVLIREALSEDLQRAVRAVFEVLTAAVARHGGTLKEYQGDAILAFWEGDASGVQAHAACRAALALDGLAQRIAADPAAWPLLDRPLRMEWALATGLVIIDSFGRSHPAGLSMMGEPVVRAFRIEKLAGRETGRIVACRMTQELAASAFEFRDMGEITAKGFDRPEHVFALVGERGGAVRSAR